MQSLWKRVRHYFVELNIMNALPQQFCSWVYTQEKLKYQKQETYILTCITALFITAKHQYIAQTPIKKAVE